MATSVLNSANITSGGTYTAVAGTNRRVVALGAIRRNTGTPTYSATFGGVSMTADVVGPLGGGGDDQLLAFSLVDASIPTGSQTLTVTASGGTILTAFHGQIYTLGGVSQSALDTPFTSNGSATASTTVTTASLTNLAGSELMAVVRNTTGDTISGTPSGWTTDRMDNSAAGMVFLGHVDAAAAATTTYTWTSLSTNWNYITLAYLAASGTPDTLMGQICL